MGDRASSGEKERGKGKDDEEKSSKAEALESRRNGNGRGSIPAPPPSETEVGRKSRNAGSIPPPPPSEVEGKKRGSLPPPPRTPNLSASDEEPRHPSIPPLPAAGPWRSYKEIVAGLAGRIVDAQRNIRVLQAIRWDNSVEEQFRKAKYRELPKVDAEYYEKVELGFDPRTQSAIFEEIARDVDHELGESDAIGAILARTALEYRDVARMLASRGTNVFYAYSRKLYGSPKDKFPDGITTLRDLGFVLYEILTNIDETGLGQQYERNIPAADAATELNQRLSSYFGEQAIRVEVDDSILSDAAAGSDYVKVRS